MYAKLCTPCAATTAKQTLLCRGPAFVSLHALLVIQVLYMSAHHKYLHARTQAHIRPPIIHTCINMHKHTHSHPGPTQHGHVAPAAPPCHVPHHRNTRGCHRSHAGRHPLWPVCCSAWCGPGSHSSSHASQRRCVQLAHEKSAMH